jgi:precorrin-6B methylase 2
MKIDHVYVACFKHNVRLVRILVASIRFWYPRIPIFLIKDCLYGPFDTREIERSWGVRVLPTQGRFFGWGFGKLEPLFIKEKQRCLILDPDIVFAGPALESLEKCDEDFIVTEENPPNPQFIEELYFSLANLNRLDPDFNFPGWTFNTGQWVATTGIFKRDDFLPWVEWASPPALKQEGIFKCGEQGLLNYFLIKQWQAGKISLRRLPLMEVANNPAVMNLDAKLLTAQSPYRFVIHWCGLRKPRLKEAPHGDLLIYFEKLYYSGVPLGFVKRLFRPPAVSTVAMVKSWVKTLFQFLKKVFRIFCPHVVHPADLALKKFEAATCGRVIAGPFKGMRYEIASIKSAHHPALFGTYEKELHPFIEKLCAENFDVIVDVGAGQGYYAVGMALRSPKARVIAFEDDVEARKLIGALAEQNDVLAQVEVLGHCGVQELGEALKKSSKPLVIMDVEGGEKELLNPDTIQDLRKSVILVEIHEFVHRKISQEIESRFKSTHQIQVIWQKERTVEDLTVRSFWLDRWLVRLLREFRPEKMCWFYMRPFSV